MFAYHNILVNRVNALKISVSNLKCQELILEYLREIFIQLQGLQHAISNLSTVVKTLFAMMIFASHGTVTPSLIDPTQLFDLIS